LEGARDAVESLQLYPDPACSLLNEKLAETLGVSPDEILVTNGSDDILNFAFMAFCDDKNPAVFADITYGFYKVFADINNLPSKIIPLKDDFTIDITDYFDAKGTIFIANPNAPTGLAISPDEVARICATHPERLVIVDEAYVDYGSQSCDALTSTHRNLVVVHTMSKSYNLAGAHIGWCVAQADLVKDLNDLKFSFNPFNLSAPTMAVGIAAIEDRAYMQACAAHICETRDEVAGQLRNLGFEVLPSVTNFFFATHPTLAAANWCARLREAGVLTRYYRAPRIDNWLRVTVGMPEEMAVFLRETRRILGA
jgi:histidinol-phosphate aminotransferase